MSDQHSAAAREIGLELEQCLGSHPSLFGSSKMTQRGGLGKEFPEIRCHREVQSSGLSRVRSPFDSVSAFVTWWAMLIFDFNVLNKSAIDPQKIWFSLK
jgi:hypothetical protein